MGGFVVAWPSPTAPRRRLPKRFSRQSHVIKPGSDCRNAIDDSPASLQNHAARRPVCLCACALVWVVCLCVLVCACVLVCLCAFVLVCLCVCVLVCLCACVLVCLCRTNKATKTRPRRARPKKDKNKKTIDEENGCLRCSSALVLPSCVSVRAPLVSVASSCACVFVCFHVCVCVSECAHAPCLV